MEASESTWVTELIVSHPQWLQTVFWTPCPSLPPLHFRPIPPPSFSMSVLSQYWFYLCCFTSLPLKWNFSSHQLPTSTLSEITVEINLNSESFPWHHCPLTLAGRIRWSPPCTAPPPIMTILPSGLGAILLLWFFPASPLSTAAHSTGPTSSRVLCRWLVLLNLRIIHWT